MADKEATDPQYEEQKNYQNFTEDN